MTEIVSEHWSQVAAQRDQGRNLLGWLDSPLVERLYVGPLTGAEGRHRVCALAESTGVPRGGRWLSLGCGGGALEIMLAEQGYAAQLDAADIAPGAIEVARANAANRGVANALFQVLDVERSILPRDTYDVVLFAMSLHHVRRLEFVLEEVAAALKPGGWLLIDEFVGASQWQWSDAQLAAINTLLAALPERYRRHAITGEIKQREERPSLAAMNAADPSESVRAAEILPLLERRFEIVDRRDYGGVVLHKLLENIVGNFDAGRPGDVELLQMLFAAEQALLRGGGLSSDFTLLAARNTRPTLRQTALALDERDERSLVAGFYPVERTPRGPAFRWTERQAWIALASPARPRELQLSVVLPPVERRLRLTVDGVEVGVIQSRPAKSLDRPQRLTFKLPATISRSPVIGLHLDDSWSPAALWQTGDTRALGIALYAARLI